jgi:hypothetical protein
VLSSFKEIAGGVERLLQPAMFSALRANARAYENLAIFEIPAILDEVVEKHVPYSVPVAPAFTDIPSLGQGAAWAGST